MTCREDLYVGSRPKREIRFYDEDDALADPTSITIRVQPPSGSAVQYATPNAAITQVSTGVWEFQFPTALTVPGVYWLHVVGAGGGVDIATDHQIKIKASHVPAA